ncbi:MAG: asparaginase [Planctomycetes bacterium]|nr:asparaginase [Planctomycetota bacterium]
MRVTVITTGGTIAKTFNEAEGSLSNDRPVIESIVAVLRLPDLRITYRHVLSKDSLQMTDDDRRKILGAVREAILESDAIVIAHGTDTLSVTGELLHRELMPAPVPIVLTGAMRPYEFRDSDALQNVTEAMLACRLVPAGVYVAMHNRVLKFPGVIKDREALTFVKRG